MCIGGQDSPAPMQYQPQQPTVIAPPTTTVEIDESDIGAATKDSEKDTGRNTLRNDLTATNMGNPIAGRGLNILQGAGAGTSNTARYN